MDLVDEKMTNVLRAKAMQATIQNTEISYQTSKYFRSKIVVVFLKVLLSQKII